MPTTVLPTPTPTLTPSELDDLIYFARTSDLPALKTTIQQACENHSTSTSSTSSPSTILTAAIDIDSDGLGSQCNLLHWPSANGNAEVVQYLLSLLPSQQRPESETNGTNVTTTTTTTAAVVGSATDRSALSLVNHQNVSGNTPLHWAALNGHLACVKALVAAGADPTIINGAGHDAVYEAECSGMDGGGEVAQWILANCKGLERGVHGRPMTVKEEEEEARNVEEGSAAAADVDLNQKERM